MEFIYVHIVQSTQFSVGEWSIFVYDGFKINLGKISMPRIPYGVYNLHTSMCMMQRLFANITETSSE